MVHDRSEESAIGGVPAIAVFGGSGFVGSHVLTQLGAHAFPIAAPRLTSQARNGGAIVGEAHALREVVNSIAEELRATRGVVIASGLSDANCRESDALFGANSLLPTVVWLAACMAGCERVVHVSSAVVQGARRLDSSPRTSALSPYASSKALGEAALRLAGKPSSPTKQIVYRPPSVHAPSRRITRAVASLARSRMSSVAAPGDLPTPQALAENVGSAVAYLATARGAVPEVVHHPWEGLTTARFLHALGNGREPTQLPPRVARAISRSLQVALSRSGRFSAQSRRLEVLWFGQSQAPSWLDASGWKPPEGIDRWREIGRELANE